MKKIFILFILIHSYACKNDKQKNSNITSGIAITTSIKEEIATKTIQKATEKTTIKEKEYNYSTDFIVGKFNYKKDSSFTKVRKKHASKTLYINKEVYAAFIKMYAHAKKENIDLKIISGTRSFYEQKGIWERKWKKYNALKEIDRALKILEYSSMPSTSRHHWGTDIDLNNLNNSYFDTGKGKKEHDWLLKNAPLYGFYQVYTSKDMGRKGYHMEKWHWSYLPLSKKYLSFYIKNIQAKDISGFKGAYLASQLNIIELYVNGINKTLKIKQ
ncbi:M15 family metallopeptidase [Tenacibaculum finnmarkense]|uniref:M15 family metallopeptidase n=1 Tax=Tenacibaculum finnmarkense TaxID=2781243 RepID=UPI001EFBD491|nr:M15 family metallopeptidase [Tenacibaculum finnmarkense]MCG8795371.1 M15 family metallopeptidase [Tenacibaculum finnmarkense]MCG8797851.1 M15 family metallopeptidase [Tenacibaculum finnmarkense]